MPRDGERVEERRQDKQCGDPRERDDSRRAAVRRYGAPATPSALQSASRASRPRARSAIAMPAAMNASATPRPSGEPSTSRSATVMDAERESRSGATSALHAASQPGNTNQPRATIARPVSPPAITKRMRSRAVTSMPRLVHTKSCGFARKAAAMIPAVRSRPARSATMAAQSAARSTKLH